MRVLLIEDTASCAELTEKWLRDWHAQLVCDKAESLREAMEYLAHARQSRHVYDLVILDLGLLDTKDLMAVGPVVAASKPSPVLIFTNGLAEWRSKALASGAALYVLKRDVDEVAFHHAVQELVPHYAV